DRIPHPALWEFKRLAQPVAVELAGGLRAGRLRLRVRNEHDFVSLAHLAGEWTLQADGEPVACGNLPPFEIAAGKTAE
ncbi:DUF4981 domain-containing protein, partial [Klebsiella pneumoniae]|nr:DUF4981 domain-containing protein [Klebsiella pneumoniae]